MQNLRYSFPEKKEQELIQIQNRFYRHFCDLFVETLKLQSISFKTIKKRIVFKNTEYVDRLYDEGRNILAVMAHYGNWEYMPSMNLHIKPLCCAIYRPLTNPYFDQLMLKIRSRFYTKNFTMKNVLRDLITLKKQNQQYLLGLISDQTPGGPEIQYIGPFLNQNTPLHLGTEKMGHLFKDVIVYLNMTKIKRGYYEVTIEPLIEKPEETSQYEITKIHTRHLEKIIQQRPELWLWSHKRWKHVKERPLSTPETHEA
jgi:KDO2-lipid IV(A) lauroyltransferase